MEISYLGHSSFKLRGKNLTLLTDPFSPTMVGFPFPKLEAEIVTVSHDHEDHNQSHQVGGKPFVISGPGEYEVKGVLVLGFSTFHDSAKGAQRGKNTVFLIEMESLRLLHLGDLGEKLPAEQLDELNGVDILFVPVGGTYTLGPKEAREVVAQLEPKIVIPMHYQVPGLNPAIFRQLFPVEEFLKQMGVKVMPLSKFLITKEKLPEEMEVVVLERKNA